MPHEKSARPLVRLEDIAQKAGVSKNTVSIALRKKPGVSEAKREEIFQIAEEMGYRPNPMISALMHNLRSGRTPQSQANIAFLHNYPTRGDWRKLQFCRELYSGVKSRCESSGYTASVFWSGDPAVSPQRLRDIMLARGICGIVVGGVEAPKRHIRLLCDDFALATLGYSLWRPALHRACTDMRHSLSLAVRQVGKLNYRRIGVVYSSISDSRLAHSWTSAIAVEQFIHPEWMCRPFAAQHVNSGDFKAWLKTEKPDVIINAGLEGIYELIRDLGVRIPEDIGYVALLGDNDATDPIATVQRAWESLGEAGVDLVVAQLMRNERGIPKSRRTVLIEGNWVPGLSVRQQS